MRFKVPLPKTKPPPRQAHFALGIYDAGGTRFEIEGTMSNKGIAPVLKALKKYGVKRPASSEDSDA